MSKKSARATTIISLLGILAFAGVFSLGITTSAHAESELVVSEETMAATSDTVPPAGNPLVVSDEVNTSTTSVNNNPLVVSNEISAKTSDTNPPPGNPLVISGEVSATSSSGSDNPLVVSDEVLAKTNGGGGGCTSNCGGGGGGGGGRIVIPPIVPPVSCPLYLTKYIRLGYNNDSFEVRKLQKFLRDFEGFNQVQITGFYDLTTYNAVRVFQMRYGKDVLNPWGLDVSDPTGFVFITTTYAINQLYCNRSTDNNFNLRHIYDEVPLVGRAYQAGEEGAGMIIPNESVGSTTGTTTVITGTVATTTLGRGFFQAAAIGLLNFFTNHSGIWLTILLFIALLVLAYLILKLQEEAEEGTAATKKSDDEWPEEVGAPSGAEVHQPIFPLIIDEDDESRDNEEIVVDETGEEEPIPELGEPESEKGESESPRGKGRRRSK